MTKKKEGTNEPEANGDYDVQPEKVEKPLTISEYKIRLMEAFQKRTNPVTPAMAMKIINDVETKK